MHENVKQVINDCRRLIAVNAEKFYRVENKHKKLLGSSINRIVNQCHFNDNLSDFLTCMLYILQSHKNCLTVAFIAQNQLFSQFLSTLDGCLHCYYQTFEKNLIV